MHRWAIPVLILLTACATTAAQAPTFSSEASKPRPRVSCRVLDHGTPDELDAQSVAEWARRELDRSDTMIRRCISGIGRLNNHIEEIQ